MKKLMKKKVNVFGKKVSIPVILAVAFIAMASAALVPYLSGTIIGTVDVESPLTYEVVAVDGVTPPSSTEFTISSSTSFALHEIDFEVHNNADVDILGIAETNITGDNSPLSDFSSVEFGEEFETLDIGIKMSDADCTLAFGDYYQNGYCFWEADYDRHFTGVIGGVYYFQMGDGTSPVPSGETMEGRLKIQFKINVAPATYTFKSAVFTTTDATNLT